jgi:hypothetical protein
MGDKMTYSIPIRYLQDRESPMSSNSKTKKSKLSPVVIVALIGLAGTAITALLTSPVLIKLLEKSSVTDGVASGFGFIVGKWTIGNDKTNKVLVVDSAPTEGNVPANATFGPVEIANGIVEWKLKYQKYQKPGNFSLCFLTSLEETYWFVVVPEQLVLGYASQAQEWKITPLAYRPITLQTDVWYTFRVEFQGEQISVYVDNNLIFKSTDSHLQTGGLSFLMDNSGTKVMLDDVKVWTYDQ